MDEKEIDLFIKSKIKDEKIPSKVNSVFENFIENVDKGVYDQVDEKDTNLNDVKKDENPSKVRKFPLKNIAAAAACIMIVGLGGGQIYASTQGYDNVFFLIKHIISGDVSLNDKDQILSDRDYTLSYEPIYITEDISIIVSNLQVQNNEAKLFVKVNEKNGNNNLNDLPLKYRVYNNSGKELCRQNSCKNEGDVQYTEELILKGFSDDNREVKLEVLGNNSNVITTLFIDLDSKVISVEGEQAALQKISEIELKDFLGKISGLYKNEYATCSDEDLLIGVALQMLTDEQREKTITGKSGNYAYEYELINNIVESMSKYSLKNFTDGEIFERTTIKGKEYLEFKQGSGITFGNTCIDIPNISFSGGIYTVTFRYCDLQEEALFDENTDYDIYQNTVSIKLNENSEYTKFKLVSMEEPTKVKQDSQGKTNNKEVNTSKNTTSNNTTSKSNSSNTTKPTNSKTQTNTQGKNTNNTTSSTSSEKIDNYASTMNWETYRSAGLKVPYPKDFSITETTSYNKGNNAGGWYATIEGDALGKEDGEIINTHMKINLYEPDTYDVSYFEGLEKNSPAGTMTSNITGMTWYRIDETSQNTDSGEYKETYIARVGLENSSGTDAALKIEFCYGPKSTYKAINMINYIIGRLQTTSY